MDIGDHILQQRFISDTNLNFFDNITIRKDNKTQRFYADASALDGDTIIAIINLATG